MKKTLTYMLIIYASVYILKFLHVSIPFISTYLADLLCMPIVLSISRNLFMRHRNCGQLVLNGYMITAAFIYFSIAFEWLLPHYSARFTADPYDVICYAIGACWYYRWQKTHNVRARLIEQNG